MFEIPNADSLLATIDIVPGDHWVFVRSRRDSHFDLRIGFGKAREGVLDEGTMIA